MLMNTVMMNDWGFRALDADLIRRHILPHAMSTCTTKDLALLLDKHYKYE